MFFSNSNKEMCLPSWGDSSAPWCLAGKKEHQRAVSFLFSLSTDFPGLRSHDNATVQQKGWTCNGSFNYEIHVIPIWRPQIWIWLIITPISSSKARGVLRDHLAFLWAVPFPLFSGNRQVDAVWYFCVNTITVRHRLCTR